MIEAYTLANRCCKLCSLRASFVASPFNMIMSIATKLSSYTYMPHTRLASYSTVTRLTYVLLTVKRHTLSS